MCFPSRAQIILLTYQCNNCYQLPQTLSLQTASRMESNGVPGLIHLSSDMHRIVGGMTNVFDFSCCGKIDIKGKGEMTTFLARPLAREGSGGLGGIAAKDDNDDR